MDGLYRSLPSPVLFPIAGKLYRLAPMTLGVLASCEAFILLKRPSPVDQVNEAARRVRFDADTADRLRQKALAEMKADRATRCVSPEALFRWLFCAEGVAHSAYWCLRRSGHPAFATPAGAEEFVAAAAAEWVASFVRARDLASGTDILAALDWKEQPEDGPAARRRYYPWRRAVRYLALEYRFPARAVARMTLYTLKAYTCEESELGGTKTMSAAELRERGVPRPPKSPEGGGPKRPRAGGEAA